MKFKNPFKRKLTVDGVLASFNKSLNKLEQVRDEMIAEQDRQAKVIAVAEKRKQEAAAEQERAVRAHSKLAQLVS